jgi:methionine sulfoxide reductase heme-binding subunit
MLKRRLFEALCLLALCVAGAVVYGPKAMAAGGSTTNSPSFTAHDAPNILVSPVPGPAVSSQLGTRARASWPWYITRAAGFVAAISLVLLMLSGVGFITGATFRFLEPLTAWATHKAIAYVFGISVAVHGLALLFDKYVPFNLAQALIPFLSAYRPVTIAGYHLGSLYIALGIFAFYFVLAIIFTSIFWMDKKPHTWKAFHILAYATMAFVFFHALFLGTDLAQGIFRVIWIILGLAVAVAVIYRLKRTARVP